MAQIMMMPQTLVDIAANGGGLDLDVTARMLMPQTMIDIAHAAAASGKKPTIIFRNWTAIMPQTANDIAAAGQGCVLFVF